MHGGESGEVSWSACGLLSSDVEGEAGSGGFGVEVAAGEGDFTLPGPDFPGGHGGVPGEKGVGGGGGAVSDSHESHAEGDGGSGGIADLEMLQEPGIRGGTTQIHEPVSAKKCDATGFAGVEKVGLEQPGNVIEFPDRDGSVVVTGGGVVAPTQDAGEKFVHGVLNTLSGSRRET
jgi:hypothetical protein